MTTAVARTSVVLRNSTADFVPQLQHIPPGMIGELPDMAILCIVFIT
jgi:hypothetical protein